MKIKSGFILVGTLLVLFLSGPVMARDWIYTTRPGDTLWDISKTHLKSVNYWKRLKEYNRVNLPTYLRPGIRLRIPVAWLKYPPEAVDVIFVNGDVSVIRADGTSQGLKAGDELLVGDTVQSQDGNASLRFADGSTLLLQSGTTIIFDSLSAYKRTGMVDTRLRLQRGRIETRVIPLEKSGSRYEIITPAAVAAVRGTQYRVNADAETNLMRAEVLEGRVDVANEKASESVKERYGTLTEAGKKPKPPVKLLDPPQLDDLSATIRKFPTQIQWQALARAKAYRVLVVADTEKQEQVYTALVDDTRLNLVSLADGTYIIKVRGIDELGLEGINATARMTVDTRLGPSLLSPEIHEPVITDRQISFAWKPLQQAQVYHVQIAGDEAFTDLLLDEQTQETTAVIDLENERDTYYFRIRAESELHEQGEFSPVVTAQPESHGILYFFGALLVILAL